MTDPNAEAQDTMPSLSAAWESAKQEARETQGPTASPPDAPAEADAGEAAEPNPAQEDAEGAEGRTADEGEPSGDAEAEQPNPEGDEPEVEAADDFDPVLKTLAPGVQEGLRALSKEQRAGIAKALRGSEQNRQDATKEAAEFRKSHEALQRLIGNGEDREAFWKFMGERKAAREAAQPVAGPKRPRPSEYDTDKEYDDAMDKYEAALQERIVSRVQSDAEAPRRVVAEAESGLREWRKGAADVTDAEFDSAAKSLGRSLARMTRDRLLKFTPESAVEFIENAIDAMRAAAPKVQSPARQPNPPPRRVQAASVPVTRGAPHKPVQAKPWEKRGDDAPTLAEAWADAEEEAAQGTRPTARNGAVR